MSTNGPTRDPDRWEELQAARLLFGLTPDEEWEYEELARKMPAESDQLLDPVVAALDIGRAEAESLELPAPLRQAIRARAAEELGALPPAPGLASRPAGEGLLQRGVPWLVAAACLLVAILAWTWPRGGNGPADPAARRAELVASAKDLVQAKWSDGPTAIAGAAGDVVWSSARQEGFMRFQGLPVNDPKVEQYQLWIFDRNQSDKTPIDGGVFDITAAGEVVLPVDPKLHVKDAYLFAITIEKPGGVVVSSRERLPLLAKVE
jgi:hypothetical protein